MPTNYLILGQFSPTTTSDATLYTVPANTQTVVSTISVTNDITTSASFRIYLRKAGAAASATNALYFDVPLAGNSTLLITAGITLNAGDVITVRTSVANALGFQAFGSQVTP